MARSFSEAAEQLAKQLNTLLSDKFKRQLAEAAKKIIYRRTKAGKGVDNNGNPETLKKLATSTITYRSQVFNSRFSAIGALGPGEFFSPRKSNATLTGQMLNAISYNITADGIKFMIERSARGEGGPSNFEVAEYYSKDRPFFNLSDDERRVIARQIEDELRKIVLKIK